MSDVDPAPVLLALCPACENSVEITSLPPFSDAICPYCNHTFLTRNLLGQYEITAVLGEGGMSRVFQANDIKLGRPVALKVLHQSLCANQHLASMFEREAKITASITHPNVVKVYTVGQDQGYLFIAMELLEAISLEHLILQQGALSEHQILRIALDVTAGLQAAADNHLIHRDIKPGNLLITHDGTTKLVDFGLALQLGMDDMADELWATPFYVPPEKLDGLPDTSQGDIYSLGATLYHALAGHPPFQADTSSLPELQTIKRRPISLAKDAPQVSKQTVQLIERMMAYRPEDRPASYHAISEALELLQASPSLKQHPFTSQARRLLTDLSTKKRPLILGSLAVIAVATGYGAYQKIKSQAPESLVIGEEYVLDKTNSERAHQFLEARSLLVGGEAEKAKDLLRSLVGEESFSPSTQTWTRFLLGTAELMLGNPDAAAENFHTIASALPLWEEGAEPLVTLLHEMAISLADPLPILPSELKFSTDGVGCLGLAAAGHKNWQTGQHESAMELWDAFHNTPPVEDYPWLDTLKTHLEPWRHDYEIYRSLPLPTPRPDEAERAQLKASLTAAIPQLKTAGAMPAHLAQRLQRLDQIEAALQAEARAREVALAEAQAKAQAAAEASAAETMPLPPAAANSPIDDELRSHIFSLRQALAQSLEASRHFDFNTTVAALRHFPDHSPQVVTYKKRLEEILPLAYSFWPVLSESLNRQSYQGVIMRRNGPAFDARITGAHGNSISVDLGFGSNEFPLHELSLKWLVAMAEQQLDAPAADTFNAWKSLASFAFLIGEDEKAQLVAKLVEPYEPAFTHHMEWLLSRDDPGSLSE